MMENTNTVGGWKAPCRSFDYRKMERDALGECKALKARLDALKAEKPKDAEKELIRRREICVLTDIYYEQRHQARLFCQRAEERERRSSCHLGKSMV